MKRIFVFFVMGGLLCLPAGAQSVTYNHDSDKMNQFTVGEIGTGTLSPDYYYWLFHNSYRKTAAVTNKLLYRSITGAEGYAQVEMADSIRTAMEKRAEIEALNIADRTNGLLSQQLNLTSPVARAATAALNRWREAGWKTAGSHSVTE